MRLVGPNCMGVLNTDPIHRLNATFAPAFPPAGRVSFLSQSGALGLAVIDHAKTYGLGISTFVSVGNKADISGKDLLESCGTPRRSSRRAGRITPRKPIIAVKAGRSAVGTRAAGSHTGALVAASDISVDALFRQCGVIRVDTVAELFEVASLLANQPPPPGRRVGILTNAGGPAILCADACAAAGLEVPPLHDETRAELAGFLPAEAGLANPVDMIASAPAAAYERAISVLGARPDLDALIVIFIKPLGVDEAEVAAAIHRGAAALDHPKPVLAVFMSAAGPPAELRLEAPRIPCYPFPEPAARALARAADWEGWRSRPPARASLAPPGIRRDAASAILAARLRDGGGWLPAPAIAGLLDSYGVRVGPS